MNRRLLSLFFSLLFVVAASIVVSCGGAKPDAETNAATAAQKSKSDSLAFRIACLPTYECLPFYYAEAAGIADSLQLDLRVLTYQSQFDADTALISGYVDAGITDQVRWKHYQSQGKLRGATQWIPLQGEWLLMVGGRLRLTEAKQLKQRTIAIARYSTSDQYTAHLRDSLRWKFDDLLRPQINDYRVRLQMLDNEQIDAAVLPQPFALRAKSNGQRVLATVGENYHQHALYLTAAAQGDQRKSAQAALLKRVYNAAIVELAKHPRAALDSVLVRKYQLSPEQLKQVRLPRYQSVK